MQVIVDFISNLRWQDWMTIGGFLFGLVTLIAYVEQRRSNKSAAKIAQWVERNLDKDISEEEIKKLLAQRAAMQEEISRNIPALARMAVIREQVELHRKATAEHFAAWQALSAELASPTTLPGVDPQIQSVILDRITPQFERQQEVDRLKTRITILSVGVAAASTVLPFGLGSVLALIVSPALLSAAVRLYALTESSDVAYKSLRPLTHAAYLGLALAAGGFGVLLLLVGNVTQIGIYMAWILVGIGVVALLAYVWLRVPLDQWLTEKLRVAKL
jgi:hypothetical protein